MPLFLNRRYLTILVFKWSNLDWSKGLAPLSLTISNCLTFCLFFVFVFDTKRKNYWCKDDSYWFKCQKLNDLFSCSNWQKCDTEVDFVIVLFNACKLHSCCFLQHMLLSLKIKPLYLISANLWIRSKGQRELFGFIRQGSCLKINEVFQASVKTIYQVQTLKSFMFGIIFCF